MKNYYFYLLLFFSTVFCESKNVSSVGEISSCEFPHAIAVNEDNKLECRHCLIECNELYERTKYDYSYPDFNPLNPEEFVYLRTDYSDFPIKKELWTYNYCTSENTLLSNSSYGLPDWSRTGWIVFVSDNYRIYKIKSNGDSLTQLTFEGTYNRHPVWSPDGTRLCYNLKNNFGVYNVIIDDKGQPLDTIDIYMGQNSWGKNGFVAKLNGWSNSSLDVAYYENLDLGKDDYSVVYSTEIPEESTSKYTPTSRTWYNNKEILWSAEQLIGISNIETGQTEIILTGFENRLFNKVDVTENGKYAIVNRVDIEELDGCNIDAKHRLYLLDLESKTEYWIEIPE